MSLFGDYSFGEGTFGQNPISKNAFSITNEKLRNRIFTRLATERGSFIYNPTIGSNFFKMLRGKNVPEVRERIEGYAREALLPEIRKGFILGVSGVRILIISTHKFSAEIDVIRNDQQILTIPIEVN